ncbi:MAG TPA: N-acetylmuramic acid 6-phosphate etherase, partial [Phycisphaerae bacterium]|nr:N-acetylmuramic acid 6-phosphate etherase [Phycisphaerae bacterium]
MHDRGHLLTEQRHPSSAGLDTLPLADAFDLMNREDATIADAVAVAKPGILAAVGLAADALARGGRLGYVRA